MQDLSGKFLVRKFLDHPILVVGASRSGTSILLQALGRHRLIYAMPGEAPFLTTIGGSAHLFELSENRSYYLDSIKTSREYLYGQLRKIAFEVAAGPHFGLRRMAAGLIGRGASPIGRRFWAAKSFPSEPVSQGLLRLYPDIRFIYIRRNGLDVVQSRTKFHGFNSKDFRSQCSEWARSVEKYDHLSHLEQAISVKQEDLLEDPVRFFDTIHDFLELPPDPGPADYAESTLVHPLDQNTQHQTSAREALATRPPAWEDWDEEQRTLFKQICGNAMEKAGYEIQYS